MELRHLRYFAAVAAHGSFSRAAANLHLTQPALSRQVKDLEDELGVLLLVRGKNAVSLSEAGEIFYEEARDLLARADLAIQRVRGEAQAEVLRIGYGPSLTAGLMPAALERFQAMAPKVKVELSDLSPREMAELANTQRIDLVILPTGFETAFHGFQWMTLRHRTLVLVLPEEHPLAKLKKVPLARLRQVPLVGLGRENFPEYVPLVRAQLKPHGLDPRFKLLVNDGVSSLFEALKNHKAAALLVEGVLSVLPRAFVTRPITPALSGIEIKLGYPAVRPNPNAEKFARLLRSAAK